MARLFPPELLERIAVCRIVAVLVIDDAQDAVPLARALLDGGIHAMELTLRTPAAWEALAEIRRHVPEMLAGLGTVLTPDQVRQAVDAGAQFAVAPGTNRRVLEAAQQHELPFAPGIATPSDLETALELGYSTVKFFPAEPSGGLKYLQSLAAPYAHLGVRFIPLGGVGLDNLTTYLREPTVVAVGGSWLATREMIRQQQWAAITQQAQTAMQRIADELGSI